MPLKTATFSVPGPLPCLNDIIAAAKTIYGYSRAKRAWTNTVCLLARRLPHFDRVQLHFVWTERDRRRDPDGISSGGRKLVLDGLVLAGVIDNDGWKQIAGWTDEFVVGARPGVLVRLDEVQTDGAK